MKKLMVLLGLMLLCSACGHKGLEGEHCLEDSSCSQPNLACNYRNRCEQCGAQEYDICFENQLCGPGLVCDLNNECVACGSYNQPACADGACPQAAGPYIVDNQGLCKECGFKEFGPCCSEGWCSSGQVCRDSMCLPCGGWEKYCCADGTCEGDYSCEEGVCKQCGDWHQECCSGNTCDKQTLTCVDKKCTTCGFEGDPCCADETCFDDTYCSDGVCAPCGDAALGQPCCPGNRCKDDYACGSNQVCHDFCGGENEPCCDGVTCGEYLTCGAGGMCAYCGLKDKPPCPETGCEGWLTPAGGECADTFELDPATDVAICQDAPPGSEYRHQRNWCYWYAADAKKDTALCSQITYSSMANTCLESEDPDDYFVITFGE